jgi:hypothetical protein
VRSCGKVHTIMSEPVLHEINRLIEQIGESRIINELGIHRTTLMRWRRGKVPIPLVNLRALRSMAYDVGVDKEWEGWRIRDGKLYSPEGYTFDVGELLALRYVYGERDALRTRVEILENQVKAMATNPHVRGESANDAAIQYVPKEA